MNLLKGDLLKVLFQSLMAELKGIKIDENSEIVEGG